MAIRSQKVRRIGAGIKGYDFRSAIVLWKDLEPTPGRWQFKAIYDKIALGLPVLIRVAVNWPPLGVDGCPSWLPAVSRFSYTDSTWGTVYEYDYNNAAFVAGVVRLAKALAFRFNGHPMVLGVEIGILGQYGEWTTYQYNASSLLYSIETQRAVIRAFCDAFTMTPLLGRSLGIPRDPTAVSVGAEFEIGIHDDVFMHANSADIEDGLVRHGLQELWKRQLMGGEVYPDYQQECLNARFEEFCEAVRTRHITYLHWSFVPTTPTEIANMATIRNVIKTETGY